MTISLRPPAPSVGRLTAVVLGFVVFVCVTMIGAAGYMKYQVDRAEAVLAAPDGALGGDQDSFGRVRHDLGYGGFLGHAQKYALAHDASGFAEMKVEIKSTDDIVAHLPDRTSAETRHEMTAIVATFDAALQKISAPATPSNPEFTAADLAPLYAAMPILEERVTASNAEVRFAAQSKMQFWGMMLTLVSWCSLILAAACAAGIYLAVRDKHSAPMRALAQSIQNMAHGDMRTAIWGIERQDMIGELARAVDIARYHFSHLPDLSLLSDQGPVRMRFEGETRSLFEAMMKAISRDSENIRTQSSSLSETAKQQKETISAVAEKVETVLNNILQHGQNGDQQIKQAIHDMVGSTEQLKNAHAHAADQLNRLIPHIQDRAAGMAEITNITGKQIAQTLQSLTASEIGLKANAEQAKGTLIKLASTADDLGERLFGAINLLQAGGKVLSETTDQLKARHIDSSVPVSAEVDLSPLENHLDRIENYLADLQNKIDERMEAPAVVASETGGIDVGDVLAQLSESSILSGIEHLIATRVDPKFTSLEQNIAQSDAATAAQVRAVVTELGDKMDALSAGAPTDLRENFQADLQQLSAQIAAAQAEFGQELASRIDPKFAGIEQSLTQSGAETATQIRGELSALLEKISALSVGASAEQHSGLQEEVRAFSTQMSDSLTALDAKLSSVASSLPTDVRQQVQEDIQNLSTQIVATHETLATTLTAQVEPKLAALEQAVVQNGAETATQLREALSTLSDKIAAVSDIIPTDLRQQMQEDMQSLSAQIVATQEALATTLGAQVDPKLAALEQTVAQSGVETATQLREALSTFSDKIAAVSGIIPTDLRQQMQEEIQSLSAQIASTQEAVVAALAAQIEPKLAVLEQAVVQSGAETATQLRETLGTLSEKIAAVSDIIPADLRQQMQGDMQNLLAQIAEVQAAGTATLAAQVEPKLVSLEQNIAQNSMEAAAHLRQQIQSDIQNMSAQIASTQGALVETLAAQVEPKLVAIEQNVTQSGVETAIHLREALSTLGDKVAAVIGIIPTDLRQQVREDMHILSTHIIETQEVFAANLAAQVEPKLALLEQNISESSIEGAAQATQLRAALVALVEKIGALSSGLSAEVQRNLHADLHGLAAQIAATEDVLVRTLAVQVEPKFAALEQSLVQRGAETATQMRDALAALSDNVAAVVSVMPIDLRQQVQGDIHNLSAYIATTQEALAQTLVAQVEPKLDALEHKLAQSGTDATTQMHNALATLSDNIAAVVSAIPAELRQYAQEDVQSLSSQIAETQTAFAQMLSAQIEPKFAAIETDLVHSGAEGAAQATQMRAVLSALVEKVGALSTVLSAELQRNLQDDLRNLVAQIASTQEAVSQTIDAQITPKFAELTQIIDQQSDALLSRNDALASESQNHVTSLLEKMAAVQECVELLRTPGGIAQLTELPERIAEQIRIVGRLLSGQIESTRNGLDRLIQQDVGSKLVALENGVSATQRVVEETRVELVKPAPKTVHVMPPEMQKQMHDQWYQMSSQIEASRSSLSETLTSQMENLESRLLGKNVHVLPAPAVDYATQQQIEQQTQILAELVATLGVLDAHMQQIKSEMRVAGG